MLGLDEQNTTFVCVVWLFAVVVLWAFFLIVKGETEAQEDTPLQLLEKRLASGEISKKEFERKKKLLELYS